MRSLEKLQLLQKNRREQVTDNAKKKRKNRLNEFMILKSDSLCLGLGTGAYLFNFLF